MEKERQKKPSTTKETTIEERERGRDESMEGMDNEGDSLGGGEEEEARKAVGNVGVLGSRLLYWPC